MTQINLDIQPFDVPDSVSLITKPGKRSDGFKPSPKFLISELDSKILSEMCNEFRKNVFEKANKKDPHLTDQEPRMFGHII